MIRLRALAAKSVPPLIVLLVVVGIWYFVSGVVLDPSEKFLLPLPHEVIVKGFLDADTRNAILAAAWVTTKSAAIGLLVAVIIGGGMAVAMAQASWVERSLYPWAILLQTVPILALVPVIGFWFGFELFARVVVCVIIALFPLIINPLQGMLSVDRGLNDLFTLGGASRFTRLIKLQLPAALPDIFVGLQTAAGLAIVGATVGDYFFGRGELGLGMIIQQYSSRLQSAQMLASVLVACLLGVIAFAVFGALGRRIVGRWSPAWGAR